MFFYIVQDIILIMLHIYMKYRCITNDRNINKCSICLIRCFKQDLALNFGTINCRTGLIISSNLRLTQRNQTLFKQWKHFNPGIVNGTTTFVRSKSCQLKTCRVVEMHLSWGCNVSLWLPIDLFPIFIFF